MPVALAPFDCAVWTLPSLEGPSSAVSVGNTCYGLELMNIEQYSPIRLDISESDFFNGGGWASVNV